jgi:predicted RNA-binding Zn-ribbon protein involved in translation (DUF1610 family)
MARRAKCAKHNCFRRVVGYSFTQVDLGVWKQYAIFKCHKCGHKESDEVFWVNPDLPTCMTCLNQTLTLQPNAQGVDYVTCTRCGGVHALTLRESRDAGF